MANSSLALLDVLADIPDFRQPSGKRYSLAAILALAVAALLCGYQSYSAIAEWGRYYGQQLARALGFGSGKTPCAATFYNVFSGLDVAALEQKLGAWAEALLQAHAEAGRCEAVAIDGKTLRGSKAAGAPAAHLLSAVGHHLGVTLHQVAVADKTNEIGALADLLRGLSLTDKVLTTDALLTQREFCQAALGQGADYVLPVKDNQPTLRAQVQGVMENLAFYSQAAEVAQTLDVGHGRIEERRLTCSSVLADHQLWPGLEQVFRVERRVIEKSTGRERQETVYGISSLSRERAGAAVLLALVRGHWRIENGSHWVRDVVYGEDRSTVRKGRVGQVMAALRNTAIGLLRVAGKGQIAKACREHAANPWLALSLLGIPSSA